MSEELMAANTEIVAESQTSGAEVESTEQTTGTTSENTTEQSAETKPEVTETQAFARRLKAETQKAIDAEYSRLYGAEYGIHSKAEYDAAIARQEAEAQRQQFQEQTGIDPEAIQPLIEKAVAEHPTVKQASEFLKNQRVDAAVSEFAKEFPELGIKTFDDIAKLPSVDKMHEYVSKYGLSLNEAYKLANYGDTVSKAAQTAQQETIKKIAANATSSPGSLSNAAEEEALLTEEEIDKMTPAEMDKNWSRIKKALKMR